MLAGLALVWVSGALYILHSNSHEVSFFSLVLISSLFLPTVPLSLRKAAGGDWRIGLRISSSHENNLHLLS